MSLNQHNIIGNVGKDPEILKTQTGTKYARFSVATNRRYRDAQGQTQENTTWHRITVWLDRLVNVVEQYVDRGDKIFVQGRVEYSDYRNNRGVDVHAADIIAENIVLLPQGRAGDGRGTAQDGPGRARGGSGGYQPARTPQAAPAPRQPARTPAPAAPPTPTPGREDDYDDLPFVWWLPWIAGATQILSGLPV